MLPGLAANARAAQALSMMYVPVPPGFPNDASWLTQAYDPGAGLVRLVRMSPDTYRDASFLDDRFLQRGVETALCRWDDLANSLSDAARADARWIFHIGHVGSTLVARLLGELPGVLAVREPRLLRDLLTLDRSAVGNYAAIATRFLSPTFSPEDFALVKATSFVSDIAPLLCPRGERALFLYATPVNYIRSILAGKNSRKELTVLADTRAARMAGRVKLDLPRSADDAHLAAAAWACEMTSLEAGGEAMPDRSTLWADFDLMLGDMAGTLSALAAHFGFAADPDTISAIANGPLMHRYSKALEYDYSPALRRDLLDEAGRDHASEIEAALAMLHKAAEQSPLLARGLARTTTES